MRLVKVEWWDAHSKDEWHDTPEGYIPLLITTVGYITRGTNQHGLLLEDPQSGGEAILPNVIEGGEQVFGTVHIPRGCIKSITVLEDDSSEPESDI